MCIIYKETIAVLKEYNIKRHYETKHKDKFKNLEGKERVEKFNFLKKNLNFQQNIFKKKCEQNVSTVCATYRVAQLIAKESKSFSDGEFVKKCMLYVIDEICPENKCLFEQVSLSRQTIIRRIEDLGLNLFEQVQDRVKHFQYFSIALDESTDMVDTAQILIFLRGVNANFEITEELGALESLSGTTTGEDIFKALLNTFKNLDIRTKEPIINLFENPFNINPEIVEASLQLEIIELQSNNSLRTTLNNLTSSQNLIQF
ncbi:hypothetical protein QTP88_021274 [Uroleucon formosanum]